MAEGAYDILLRAVARNADIVLSLPSGNCDGGSGALKHHKSRFLSGVPTGFWIESAPAEQPLIDALAGSGQPIGVSFRSGGETYRFATPIRRQDPLRINATERIPALLLGFPPEIRSSADTVPGQAPSRIVSHPLPGWLARLRA